MAPSPEKRISGLRLISIAIIRNTAPVQTQILTS